MSINIFAQGHLDYYDSYGLIACQLARHLTALGMTVNALVHSGARFINLPDDIAAIAAQQHRPAAGGIFLGYPTSYVGHGAAAQQRPRIAITMFESSKLPEGWVEVLNGMDAVIVPGGFCRDMFRKSGVTAPIYAVPLGIGEFYRYAHRSADRPLTFLAFRDRGERKGGVVAEQAFLRAFGTDCRYKLILKGRTPKPGRAFTYTNPNIEVLQRDMSEEELYQLYLSADVLINPNMGEGFGLLPREFAATGGIALATEWGGTADDLPLWGWPLPYTLVKAEWRGHPVFANQELGLWAQPHEEGIAQCLRIVAANIESYRTVAKLWAGRVAEMYSWQRFAERVLTIWEQVSAPLAEAA